MVLPVHSPPLVLLPRTFRNLFCTILFLVFAINVFSQDAASILQSRFETYNSYNYQEKVFLHTDKTVYATGEILWFKCYVTDAANNHLSALSKICYVEIIGNDKKQLLQAKIDIDSGTGNGSFTIPSSKRTGNYLIRAYTNWMKNFDAAFYFEQSISIINPDKKAEVEKTVNIEKYSMQLFPEGGNLVYGLNSTVAFKITDAYGKGLPANGIILNEKNDTILNFITEKFGMGTFTFTPVKGNKYRASVNINDKTFINNLPEIYNNGWAMHLNDEGNTLHVNATSNIETEHSVCLFAQTKGAFKFAKIQYLKNGAADFIINKSDLGEGISQLTIFNENKQPVCERLYFKKPTKLLQVKINNGANDFQKRKKVNISVETNGPDGKPVNADMSVSVYLTDSLQPAAEINILNYLWLSSDIKGLVESPQYYFENTDAEVDKATDNLMLTQGWRRFKWEDVLKNSQPSFTYLPEREGHIISGKVLPGNAAMPDTAIPVYVSVPGTHFKFSGASSSSSGVVRFNVEKFYGSHELIAQPALADSSYRLLIENPFSEKFPEYGVSPINLTSNLKNEILMRSIGAQSNNIYQPDKTDNYFLPETFDTTAFYGYPSKTYYLDDYTRFHSMEEVMREYVKEVHVRNRQNTFHYEVYNELEKLYFNDDPLVLLDGLPVININKIMEMEPLKIKKIDIITTRFFDGAKEYEGIVSYSTYNGDLEGYELSPGSLVFEYNGLQFEREFYSPQYETEEKYLSRKPDLRNVLYWSPHLKTLNGKQDISFYTSDVARKYLLIVQGISDGGFVGTGIKELIVK
ncbi:MAG: hypothetical protein M3Z92_10385 [Bacteroidota bacterium]|nr:hypothetical protein [Bacteroidota bacterium]